MTNINLTVPLNIALFTSFSVDFAGSQLTMVILLYTFFITLLFISSLKWFQGLTSACAVLTNNTLRSLLPIWPSSEFPKVVYFQHYKVL